MTPEQRAALIAACDAGDEVRCTTIALQICATAAREGRREIAQHIRLFVDNMLNREVAEKAYKRKRLEIAGRIIGSHPTASVHAAVGLADLTIKACAETPIP